MVESDKVEWMMAVASDASGVLPMWAQKMGLPGAIAKDVGLFLKVNIFLDYCSSSRLFRKKPKM